MYFLLVKIFIYNVHSLIKPTHSSDQMGLYIDIYLSTNICIYSNSLSSFNTVYVERYAEIK